MNIGLVGASKIANKIMAKSLNDAGFNIVAVSSSNQLRGIKLAEKYNARYYQNYADIISSDEADSLYISLPNSLHYSISHSALTEGKNVLIEKPMALTLSEVQDLVKTARNNNLSIMENFQFQYHDQFKFILKEIEVGSLSNIRTIFVKFGFPLFSDKANIRYQKSLGGGALLDAGAYISKVSSLLMNGDDYKVLSSLSSLKNYDVDMFGSCIITEKNTDFSVLGSWGFCNEYQCSLEIWSEDSVITFNRIFTAPPGFNAPVKIKSLGQEKDIFFSDNCYIKSANQFRRSITDSSIREQSYSANIKHSLLLELIKSTAI